MMKTRFAVALAMSALLSPLAFADWQIGPGSQVQFVSIKNNTVGEVSHFETLSGSVTDAGDVEVRVVLDSVETNVGIRNERMKTMLFEVGLYPEAVITAQLDAGSMAAMSERWRDQRGATNRLTWPERDQRRATERCGDGSGRERDDHSAHFADCRGVRIGGWCGRAASRRRPQCHQPGDSRHGDAATGPRKLTLAYCTPAACAVLRNSA